MSQTSKIEWTEATWNPVRGCTKVSPGCAHCYAETFAERFRGVKGHPYEQGFDLRLVPEKLTEPLRWKKPRRVFVNSMSDLFHEAVPDEFIDQVFAVMALAPRHTFQVLTKRPERMRQWFDDSGHDAVNVTMQYPPFLPANGRSYPRVAATWPLPNVWLGVSVENQRFADERIPLLLQTPAAVRFISAEPLLEHVNLLQFMSDRYISVGGRQWIGAGGIGWVIVGGESGHGARPFDADWARALVGQCRDAGVAVFVKQLGAVPLVKAWRQQHWEWRHIARDEAKRFTAYGVTRDLWRVHLTSRKGGDPSEWPEDLRIRQFPEMRPHALVR